MMLRFHLFWMKQWVQENAIPEEIYDTLFGFNARIYMAVLS